MAQQQQQQQSKITGAQLYAQWRNNTRQQVIPLQSAPLTQFSQIATIEVRPVGWLSNLYVNVTGNITVGGTTITGNFASYPPSPFNIIKQFRLYTNMGVEIIRSSGWGLALFDKYCKTQMASTINPVNEFGSQNNYSRQFTALPATVPVAGSYPVNGWWKLPISTEDWLMWGMLLLQNNQVKLNLDVMLCSQSDIQGTVAGTSLTFAPSFNVQVHQEFYSQPSSGMPNSDWIHTVIEEFVPYTVVGDINYEPPRGQIMTRLIGQVENNGAQLSGANINSTKIQIAETVTPYYETYQGHVLRNYFDTNQWLPDGCVFYDFADGYGIPEIMEPRDFLNITEQTDFRQIINISGITPTNAQVRYIKEQLGKTK